MNRDSDLIAIPYILGLFAAVIVVLAGFFLVGPVVGVLILIIALCAVGYFAYRGLNGNDSNHDAGIPDGQDDQL